MMGLGPRKRWGQNFLINRDARHRIVDLLDVREGHRVWEIGPGLGAITVLLAEKTENLTLFEIDPGYCEYLGMALEKKGVTIIQGDVMRTWKIQYDKAKPDRLIGNLPYNAASAIIGDFIETGCIPDKMIFTVQNEMGERMKASPGGKNYSSFSILCQYATEVIDRGLLNAGSFYPAPRVSSRVMELRPRKNYVPPVNKSLFHLLIRDLFISRRKTLRNNIIAACSGRLKPWGKDNVCQAFLEEGINLDLRPEKITVDQYISLSNRLNSMVN